MPADDRVYSLDVSAWLCEQEDTLTRVTLDAAPSGEGELIPWYVSVDGAIIHARMFGGVAARIYRVRVIATAASERQQEWLVSLPIDPSLAVYPVPSPPNPDFGEPIMWPCNTPPYGPAKNLPPYTVAASGTSQLTGAVVPILAITLINAGSGGFVTIGVPAATWNGYEPVFQNRSGGPVTLCPFSGDQFESLGANAGTIIQNFQSVTLSVAQSGAIIIR
ncbi:MAG: hypothetical protein P4L90_25745 [Rhodopila sp.]|nr:hypothetical protein [Rhodopila sp.]